MFTTGAPDKEGPNEDAAALFAFQGRGVMAVADGLGGQPGGHGASVEVMESLRGGLAEAEPGTGTLRGPILDAVEAANAAIRERGIGAATTLVVAELEDKRMRPYHVGDSGMLVVGQRGRIKLRTVPHSPVGYGLAAGLLDEEEALHHEHRHLVSNAVGTEDMRIEVGSPVELAPRDTLLLATDGLFDNMTEWEIVETIRAGPLAGAAETLAGACRQRMAHPEPDHPSKPDDLTFLLFRLHP